MVFHEMSYFYINASLLSLSLYFLFYLMDNTRNFWSLYTPVEPVWAAYFSVGRLLMQNSPSYVYFFSLFSCAFHFFWCYINESAKVSHKRRKLLMRNGTATKHGRLLLLLLNICIFEYYYIGPMYIQLPVVCTLRVAITVDYYMLYMIRLCQSEFYF